MAKRRAAKQLTRDNLYDEDGSSGASEEENQIADPSVIAKRKIALPRSRIARPTPSLGTGFGNAFSGLANTNPGSAGSTNPTNPFAALTGSKPSVSTPAATAIPKANPFDLLKPNATGTTATTATTSNVSQPAHSSTQLEFKALNDNFTSKIITANEKSNFEDLSSLCQKYIDYATSITKTDKAGPIPSIFGKPGSIKIESTKAESTKSEPAKPLFATSSEPTEEKKPLFSFGTANQNLKQGGSTLDSVSDADVKLGGVDKSSAVYQFGKETSAKEAPVFKFGSAAVSVSTESASKPEEPKPAASKPLFGSEIKPSALAEPLFGTGSNNGTTSKSEESSDKKPLFSFGKSLDQPSFSFTPKPVAAEPKEAESKGSESKEETSKPLFSFGNSAFGATSANKSESSQKPLFSFDKPAFGVAATPATTSTKPSEGDNKPLFSFGKPALGSTPGPWKQSDGIKIVQEQKPASIAPIATPAQTAPGSGEADDNDNKDTQLDLAGPGPGEEDEDCVYDKKTKVFEMKDGEYKTLGVGFMRVLVHKETKKSRVLVRAEGSGRILLNIALRKEFTYSVVGKGQVKVIDIVPGSEKPSVYLLRVKTEEDGNELKDKLEEVKN